jgi:hypothetical protein
MKPNINEIRAALRPVGDPYDWENNEDYMHPDNFKIRLFSMLDDVSHFIKTGDRSKFIKMDDFLAEMEQLSKENAESENKNGN